jgi:hypothetical protein
MLQRSRGVGTPAGKAARRSLSARQIFGKVRASARVAPGNSRILASSPRSAKANAARIAASISSGRRKSACESGGKQRQGHDLEASFFLPCRCQASACERREGPSTTTTVNRNMRGAHDEIPMGLSLHTPNLTRRTVCPLVKARTKIKRPLVDERTPWMLPHTS